MPSPDPYAPVESLKGIGPATAARLAGAGIVRVTDLLLLLPTRYECVRPAASLAAVTGREGLRAIDVTVRKVVRRWLRRRGRSMVVAELEDAGGGAGRAVWFNQRWVADRLEPGSRVRLTGTVREGKGGVPELLNPRIGPVDGPVEAAVRPVYPSVAGFPAGRVRRMVEAALETLPGLPDPLPDSVRRGEGLPGLAETLEALHRPLWEGDEAAFRLTAGTTSWQRRLAFDTMLAMTGAAARRRAARSRMTAPACVPAGTGTSGLEQFAPFPLTGAQRRALEEIVAGLAGPAPMARLLQGDVGSGKTVVAALAALAAIRSGFQVAFMAPTEILASQHAVSLGRYLDAAGVTLRLLTGSVSGRERDAVLSGLAGGAVDLVVGTHALVQEGVGFARLGLAIVDEQHRFGVLQRRALWSKGDSPHLLVMTATPIPRSLALTLYGDLDLSVIDELPPGRRPVRTFVRDDAARERVLTFLERELAEGGKAFIVFPRIGDDGDGNGAGGMALEAAAPALRRRFARFGVAAVHGRMPAEDRAAALDAFRAGSVRLLLATTVVEVGVDVPDATVMVIESAERFGLGQLHQLRGRVGRGGGRRAWCILVAGEGAGRGSLERLEALASCRDGFEVAERDLELRGAGDFDGVRQWGAGAGRHGSLLRYGSLLPRVVAASRRLAGSGELEAVLAALARLHGGECGSDSGTAPD